MAVKWKWNNNAGGGSASPELTQKVNQLETNYTTLNNSAVKTTGDQSIAGVKTFTGTGEVIKLNSGTDTSAYMSGYKSGNQRVWYFGKGSSSSNDFYIGADRGTIILEASSNVHLKASNVIHCNSKKLTNVADPAANTDAATKQYVDNRIKYRTLDVNIANNQQNQINPTSGYQIINIRVGRKRSEGFYFTEYNSSMNFQVFLHTNGNWIVYNGGTASGFDNNFRIFITEMKV